VQERFLNNLYSKERATATQDVDAASTEYDYVKSLLQITTHITKFLSCSVEERLTDMAFRADKLDPTMRDEHVNRVSRVYLESNISAAICLLLEAMTETNGYSPVYDNFPASIKTLSQDQGGITLGILTELNHTDSQASTKGSSSQYDL
jgi:hypothetical protein